MKKHKKALVYVLTMALTLSLLPYTLNKIPTVNAAEYGISNPRVEKNGTVVTWDCIYFGNYWQNDINGDGKADQNDKKEPIKWRVLSVDGDDAFLLADQNLDCQPYNEESMSVTWETCTLRQWLNNDFYQNAFDSTEQNAVQTTVVINEEFNPTYGTHGGNNTSDKVYLLSIDETGNTVYGFYNGAYINNYNKTRESKNTEYTKGCGSYTETETGNGWWWLRSPGITRWDASLVRDNRAVYINYENVNNTELVVRPALHLNLSSSVWSKAGTVTDTLAAPKPTNTLKPQTTIKPTQAPKPTVTPSPSQTAKPRTVTAPGKVKKLTAKNKKKKSVALSWKKVKGAKGYEVQYVTNKAFSKKTSKFVKKTKFTARKLKKKKTYYFRVGAYKLNGKQKVYGKWSAVKRVKIKK